MAELTMIVSPQVLLVMLVVIVLGYIILEKIVQRKYGYTKKREQELEHIGEQNLKDNISHSVNNKKGL